MSKDLVTGILAILIVLGAVASLFLEVNELGAQLVQVLASLVVGFYFGRKDYPLSGVLPKKK